MKTLERGLALVGEELTGLGYAKDFKATGDQIWLPGAHAMGTLRMASIRESGVVDANCCVHGVQNLYVASSAAFSTGGFANPTLTIIALALRLAKHLGA
jgi:choline dehydrogenase-like flavoprotein